MERNIRSNKRDRVPVSCTECHRRKKKCNRLQPCNDCIGRGVPQQCVYLQPTQPIDPNYGISQAARSALTGRRAITGSQVIPITRESILELGGPMTGPVTAEQYFYQALRMEELPMHCPSLSFGLTMPRVNTNLPRTCNLGSTFPRMLPGVTGEHVFDFPTVTTGLLSNQLIHVPGGVGQFVGFPNTPDAPMPAELLIQYYITRLAPWISYLDDTLTPITPRLGWLQFAVNHSPLFHATLLTSAVHLNRRNRLKDPSALLFYKLQTIRHANEMMNYGTIEDKSSDEMIITALCLLYFDINEEVKVNEYMVHLKGIERMVAVRGGAEKLGMRGMVKNWLGVCHGPWSPGFEEGGFSESTDIHPRSFDG